MKHKIDLDEARQIEQAMSPLPWIVLEEENGEMIIIRNSNHPMHKDGLIAWGQENAANTPDAIGIAYMRENFSNLIGEIERLRASLIDLHADDNIKDAAFIGFFVGVFTLLMLAILTTMALGIICPEYTIMRDVLSSLSPN